MSDSMHNSEVEHVTFPRTQGDGMEVLSSNAETSLRPNKNLPKFRLCETFRLFERPSTHLEKIIPKGKITVLSPKLVQRDKKILSHFAYAKEPKFVPYEPFKAAVTHILPKNKRPKKKASKNNVDIQILVSQMSNMASVEFKNRHDFSCFPIQKLPNEENDPFKEERQRLQFEIQSLKDSNAQLEKQLKFQTQVNSELKTLLVAAVGEDLEARVQLLTEDKLQLARALLSSAQHLSTHREQVEWLAGHCEVWRSKFLASSLMVDELARWKTKLSSQIAELQECIKRLLEEQNHINVDVLHTWQTLLSTAKCFDVEVVMPNTLNIVSMISSCKKLSDVLARKILGDKYLEQNEKSLDMNSPATVLAQEILTKTNMNQADNLIYNVLRFPPTEKSSSGTQTS